jgi:ketosteroid isomerase-like protein
MARQHEVPQPITPSPYDPITPATLATIDRFNEAFNQHDVDAVMALMTEDVIFENTSPPPDGERHQGQAAVRAFWEKFFADSPRAHFTAEEIFASGDRCAVAWRYSWGDGHIRGVDLFRVRDGKVAEKLSYVKG